MKVINCTKFSKIDLAIELFYKRAKPVAESLLELPPNEKDFTYTVLTNREIALSIYSSLSRNIEVKVYSYKPWNPWSVVIGYSNGSGNIYVNERKINSLDVEEYAGNIFHELLHVLGFSHGSNKITEKKKKSVPYAVGYLMSGKSRYPLSKYPNPLSKYPNIKQKEIA